MKAIKNVALARTLGVLAIVTLPAFVWFGWWMLGVSCALAIGAAFLTPGSASHPSEGRWRKRMRALQQKAHPHSWRPGKR